jgi:TPR repeat protein
MQRFSAVYIMRFRHFDKAWMHFAGLAILLFFSAWHSSTADAKRLAFVVGVGEYDSKSGLPVLGAPANDAQDVKAALERLPRPFSVEILTNDQAKDKDTFQAAFDRFLGRIEQGDDVLFYFSGHGFSSVSGPDKKNYYLLKSAKSNTAYFKDLNIAELRELDTAEKKNQRYKDFITKVALAEDDIEQAIVSHKPNVIILIADACRSLIEGTKGAGLDTTGYVVLPTHSAAGTYRLYSASEGQVSLDSPEALPRQDQSYKPQNIAKEKDRKNSLFTHVLVPELQRPGQPILVMAAQVKSKVRTQARKLSRDQIPDYNEDASSTDYYFWPTEAGNLEVAALCQTKKAELQNLQFGIAAGALSRESIEEKFAELARCGPEVLEELRSLRQIEAQGTGSLASQTEQAIDTSKLTDPLKICELKGSSPLDADRPQGSSGIDVQKLAAFAISGEGDRKKAELEIKSIVEACEQAAAQRPRVARYKFNAARGNYALATITNGIERTVSLRKASLYSDQAVDLDYPAAFNYLAVMVQRGEFYKDQADKPEPADRDKAVKLLIQGAQLNDVVAQYSLGMAYLRGELGLGKLEDTPVAQGTQGAKLIEERRQAIAFKYLSAASEHSYVPAMVETAKLLHDGKGVDANPARAEELLKVAAAAGSWDAMYWLGHYYQRGDDDQLAVIWYARAAEAGDVKSQTKLAEMLHGGEGVPARQPEAAGRYFRLAAYAGSAEAQAWLGDLLRDKKVPFRPVAEGKPDGGALEIRTLYLGAFANGNPKAGLALARLYRTGFPEGKGSEAIPKDPDSAVKLLYRTIQHVRQAPADSFEADPKIAARAAFELISMYDKGDAKRSDGTSVLSEDEILQLRQEYGGGDIQGYIRVGGIGTPVCGDKENVNKLGNEWLALWDSNRDESPAEPQLRWLERRYSCAESEVAQARQNNKREPKPEDTGFSREFREKIARQYRAARDDIQKNGAKAKSFYDRMAEIVSQKRGR